jgi:hypothetical protein
LTCHLGRLFDYWYPSEASWRAPSFIALSQMKLSSFVTGNPDGPLRNCIFTRFHRATRSSIALAHVKAKYRWMLTGTPVTNTLWVSMVCQSFDILNSIRADIYGLLRFGRFRPWNDWNAFNEHVVSSGHFYAHVGQTKTCFPARPRYKAMMLPWLVRMFKVTDVSG